jgi:hypothetical protein
VNIANKPDVAGLAGESNTTGNSKNLKIKLVNSAEEELLIIFPTTNISHCQSVKLLNNGISRRRRETI